MVNGAQIFDHDDDDFLGTLGVGVAATSGLQADVDIRYDNFTVLPIGCGSSESVPVSQPFTAEGVIEPGHLDGSALGNAADGSE